MKNYTLKISCILLFSTLSLHAEDKVSALSILRQESSEVTWNPKSKVVADLDCDGKLDVAFLGRTDEKFLVAAILGPVNSKSLPSSVELKNLKSEDAQDRVSESDPVLSKESMNYDTIDSLGENPPGFKRSKTCSGLNLSSGGTDSFHFYWNHKTNQLDWWRL